MLAARCYSLRTGALASARPRCANAAAASTFHPALEQFATVDPEAMSPEFVYTVPNLLNGKWCLPAKTSDVPDPLTGKTFLKVADTQVRVVAGRARPWRPDPPHEGFCLK